MKKYIKKLKQVWDLIYQIRDKELMHYASSLSFHTVLSLVPLLLVFLSIFTKLPSFDEYYERLESFIFSSLLPTHQDIISSYLQTFLSNTVGMGMVGVIVVLFVSMMFFVDYEFIIRSLLKSNARSFWQSLSAYWTLLTLAPIGLIISFYLSNLLQERLSSYSFTNWINIFSIFPYLIVWGLFYTIYMISSSAELKARKVALASFIASLAWYFSKTLFIYYVFYNKTYASIYGSFSVVLFFLMWIYLSWIIFLYGVRLCYILHIEKISDDKEENKNS